MRYFHGALSSGWIRTGKWDNLAPYQENVSEWRNYITASLRVFNLLKVANPIYPSDAQCHDTIVLLLHLELFTNILHVFHHTISSLRLRCRFRHFMGWGFLHNESEAVRVCSSQDHRCSLLLSWQMLQELKYTADAEHHDKRQNTYENTFGSNYRTHYFSGAGDAHSATKNTLQCTLSINKISHYPNPLIVTHASP